MSSTPTKASRLEYVSLGSIGVSDTEAQKARRKRFDKGRMAELAESVKTHGVLQPIVVRARTDVRGPRYELVAGERRFLAAQTAGLEEIPAVVRQLTDEQVIEVQLIENLQRADIHPMEEAEGYQQLMRVHGHPVEDLHTRVGKSRSYVYGRLKLLALCKKAREAFYDGTISASVALLIARIPVEKLQQEALKEVTQWGEGGMRYSRASQYIHNNYMLNLKEAPFPADDAKLNGKAGPCTTCPKRTGNQPELFGDVSSADICTDPTCFREKTLAFGNRALAEARERGQETITGAKAKQVAPRGADKYSSLNGWHRLDEKNYNVGKSIEQIVGKSAERALLQDPESGAVIEVVSEAAVKAALKASGKPGATARNPQTAAEQKAKFERKFRRELYARVRPALPAPKLQTIAAVMLGRLHHETLKTLCDVRGFEPPQKKYYGHTSKDYTAVGKGVETWSDAQALELINDMIYVADLQVHTYSDGKAERLLEAAAAAGVDVAALKRELAPKKKPPKKKAPAKANKKVARKKVAKRTAA